MENVTGITSAGNGQAIKGVTTGPASLGYRIESKILHT